MTQPGQQPPQLFADSRVVSMFPTCVWVHDLKPADIESVNGQILPAIRAQLSEQGPAAAEDNAIRQTRHDLQNDERFQGFIAFARPGRGDTRPPGPSPSPSSVTDSESGTDARETSRVLRSREGC